MGRRSREIAARRNPQPHRSKGKCNSNACQCECHDPDMSQYIGTQEWAPGTLINGKQISKADYIGTVHEKWMTKQHEGTCYQFEKAKSAQESIAT